MSMNYKQLEDEIRTLVSGAEHDDCIQFAIESIEILRAACDEAIEEELDDSERDLLNDILLKLEHEPAQEVLLQFNILDATQIEDDVRASEFSNELIELHVCIASFLQYRITQSADQIFDLCISMINWVDYLISCDESGDESDYFTDNMLGDPRMLEEIERQRRLLRRQA
jgi:hypothetical protein